MQDPPRIAITADYDAVRVLWTEYWSSLGLPSAFQGFAHELRTLPGKYAQPGGALALAHVQEDAAGTVAMRPLTDWSCEVKRLYVRPEFRGQGVARALMRWIIQHAHDAGYTTMYGDTLPVMSSALEMYRGLGFRQRLQPYSGTPTPGAIYLELDLN